MSLPASGPISMSMVMTEMSQSLATNYFIGYWTQGANDHYSARCYAPINVLSSGSRFNETTPLTQTNLSMSVWYGYNHTASIGLDVTGTLYPHANFSGNNYASTMLAIDVGTTSQTLYLKVSGSANNNLEVYYGKPWKADSSAGSSSLSTLITSSTTTTGVNFSYTYAYTYDSAKGRYIYFILYNV